MGNLIVGNQLTNTRDWQVDKKSSVEVVSQNRDTDYSKGKSVNMAGQLYIGSTYRNSDSVVDLVSYNNCLLSCKKTHVCSVNTLPTFILDDNVPVNVVKNPYWDFVLTGIKGNTGEKGTKGDKGEIGSTGLTGPVGPQGPMGPQGFTGSTGPQGPRGYSGSVDNFVVLSEDEWDELTSIDPNKFYYVYEDVIESSSLYAYVDGETLVINGDIDIYTLVINSNYCSISGNTLIIEAGVLAPVFSVQSGVYSNEVTFSISTNTIGAEIYYTYDGTEPTKQSYQYTGPITTNTSKTVKAKAFRDGMMASETVTAVYTIGDQSVYVDNETLVDPTGVISGETWVINCQTTTSGEVLIF